MGKLVIMTVDSVTKCWLQCIIVDFGKIRLIWSPWNTAMWFREGCKKMRLSYDLKDPVAKGIWLSNLKNKNGPKFQ